jgi:hypothetical protein
MMKFVEPLLMAMAGLACYWLGQSHAPVLVDFVQNEAWRSLLQAFGVMLAWLAIISLCLAVKGRSLAAVVSAEYRSEITKLARTSHPARTGGGSLWLVLLILGIALWLRIAFLWQPMRYDESDTLLRFVHGGLANALSYPSPNNHVFNTLLERVSCFFMGPIALAARLPAFVAGVLLVLVTFAVSRKMNQGRGGVVAALCVAVSPFLVLYATNGRGYSLLTLLVVSVIGVSVQRNGRQVSGRWGLAALLSAMGMSVIPTMLFPVASVCAWVATCLALETRDWRRVLGYLLAYGTGTAIMTLLLYAPVVLVSGGFAPLISNRYVVPLPMDHFTAAIIPHMQATVGDFLRDIPSVIAALVFMASALGIFVSFRERQYALALLFPMFFVGAAVLFFLKHSIPFSRTWIYFIPVLAISADCGSMFFFARLPARARVAADTACVAAGALIAFSLISTGAIAKYPDTGSFGGGEAVAGYLAPLVSRGDIVCAQQPADVTTAYYLWRDVSVADYLSRQVTNRKFFLQILPASEALEIGTDWRLLIANTNYALYEWDSPTEAVARSTCWSPFRQAER